MKYYKLLEEKIYNGTAGFHKLHVGNIYPETFIGELAKEFPENFREVTVTERPEPEKNSSSKKITLKVPRNQAIYELARHDFDIFDDKEYFNILEKGCPGYASYSNKELSELYSDIFNIDGHVRIIGPSKRR